jgi:hypothetical protein
MGTIGTVRAVFEADTSGFDASTKSATASLGQLGEQAAVAGQKVDAATRLQEAAARRVQRVLQQVAAEQKALAGQNVSAGAQKVAAATLEQSRAFTELRRVQGLVRSGYVDETTSVDLLAAAQSRATQASAALAEAKDREGAAAELAGVREALAGQKVTEEALRTTAALRQQAEAQSLLSRTQALVAGGTLVGPEGTQLLAAAQLKAVSAAAEVAAAKKAEAVAVAEAAEEEALSQNVIVRAFQRVALAARESLDSIKERLSLVVEGGGLEVEGISRAFAGLGSALGAGLAVGFVGDYLDGLAKLNVELDHLATKTGIDIQQLAGLQQIVKEMGGEWDPVTMGLVRMQRAQVLAVEGAKNASNAQVRAFQDIGISVQQLEHLSPEQLFVRVASAIAHIQQPAVATAAAMGIFGRGGAALIPIFKEQGDQLEANMTKTGKLTGITDKSAEAARRWTADTARLSAEFRSVMMPVMEHAEDVVKGVGGAFMAAFSMVDSVLETAAAGIISIVEGIGGLGKALYDISSGNYLAAWGDVTGTKDKIVKNFKDAFADIGSEWKKTYHLFTDKNAAPPSTPGGDTDTDLSGLERPASGAQEKAARAQMEAFENQYAEMEKAGNADVFQTRAFWQKKLEAMQKGAAEYDAAAGNLNFTRINEKLGESTKRMDEELEKSLHRKKPEGDESLLREQERAADEQAKRVTEIRQQAADAQAKLAEKAQLSDVSIALSHGEISKYQALVAEAQIHAAAFGAEIADVERRLAEAQAMKDLPGMQEQIAKLQAQLAQLRGQAQEQQQQDSAAIDAQTPAGAFRDAMNEWVQQSTDAAALIRKTFTETATGINDDLARFATDPARTGYERMLNLRNSLSGTIRGVANQGITFGLSKLESTLPGDLGKLFGGGKKPTGSKGDPLYVMLAGVGSAGGQSGGGTVAQAAPEIAGLFPRTGAAPSVVSAGASEANRALGPLFSPSNTGLENAGRAGGGQPSMVPQVLTNSGRFIDSLFSKPSGAPAGPSSASDDTGAGGSSYLDALATLAPVVTGSTGGVAPTFWPGNPPFEGSTAFYDASGSAPYTAADLSMMQPDTSGLTGLPQGSSTQAPGQLAPQVTVQTSKPSGVGSMVQSLVGMGLKLIPGFATGGPIAPDMGSFIVGEEGPELLNIGSASAHVTPNSQLKSYGSGGDTHNHTWNVDARGSNDPGAFEAAMNRVMPGVIKQAAQMGMQGTRENKMRRPTSVH